MISALATPNPLDFIDENCKFSILIKISTTYPLTPPEILFKSRIFHPNIHPKTGEICLDILKQNWTPAWTLINSCRAILILLSNPEPNSPLNCDAGNLLRNADNRGFSSLCKLFSLDHSGNSSVENWRRALDWRSKGPWFDIYNTRVAAEKN